MNLNQQQASGRQTLSSIKNLRSIDLDSKPLHIAVLSTCTQATALVSRMATCGSEHRYQHMPSNHDHTEKRYMINDRGNWVQQSRTVTKAKKELDFAIVLTLTELVLAGVLAWQLQSEEFRTVHRNEAKVMLMQAQNFLLHKSDSKSLQATKL